MQWRSINKQLQQQILLRIRSTDSREKDMHFMREVICCIGHDIAANYNILKIIYENIVDLSC